MTTSVFVILDTRKITRHYNPHAHFTEFAEAMNDVLAFAIHVYKGEYSDVSDGLLQFCHIRYLERVELGRSHSHVDEDGEVIYGAWLESVIEMAEVLYTTYREDLHTVFNEIEQEHVVVNAHLQRLQPMCILVAVTVRHLITHQPETPSHDFHPHIG